jgi:hypothetical protein
VVALAAGADREEVSVNYYLDTEFNGFNGELISLALVADDGRPLYLVAGCEEPQPWVLEHVMPILDAPEMWRLPLNQFGRAIATYLRGDKDATIVADWPDDIAYFCKAIITGPGQMTDIPGLKFEMYRVDAYPTSLTGAVQHNALWDARALRFKLTGKGETHMDKRVTRYGGFCL